MADASAGRASEALVVEWMAQYGTDVKRLCLMLLKDLPLAEDAAQETFLKAWRSYAGFRQEAGEKTWLMHIALNVCRDMLRTHWFRRFDRGITPEELPLAYDPAWPDPTLAAAIAALPLHQREAILLRYWQGMEVGEIARTMGCSINTVKSNLQRGKRRLKERLERWYYDE
ncbi:MAG: RNA polymerase sigma factor [Clostridia bacterium]|nr:RNA polymerase sigma factor [Clostridia bacterium]